MLSLKLKLKPLEPELQLICNIRPPVRIKALLMQRLKSPTGLQQLLLPMQLKQMTVQETKEYHLKKFAEWGKKFKREQKAPLVYGEDGKIYRNGKLFGEIPNYEEKQWVLRKLKHPDSDWRRWSQ